MTRSLPPVHDGRLSSTMASRPLTTRSGGGITTDLCQARWLEQHSVHFHPSMQLTFSDSGSLRLVEYKYCGTIDMANVIPANTFNSSTAQRALFASVLVTPVRIAIFFSRKRHRSPQLLATSTNMHGSGSYAPLRSQSPQFRAMSAYGLPVSYNQGYPYYGSLGANSCAHRIIGHTDERTL